MKLGFILKPQTVEMERPFPSTRKKVGQNMQLKYVHTSKNFIILMGQAKLLF